MSSMFVRAHQEDSAGHEALNTSSSSSSSSAASALPPPVSSITQSKRPHPETDEGSGTESTRGKKIQKTGETDGLPVMEQLLQPDWRKVVASLLGADPGVDNDALLASAQKLGDELRRLARVRDLVPLKPPEPPKPEYKCLYRVCCEANANQREYTLDTEAPYHILHIGLEGHLINQNRVPDVMAYIRQNQHVSFIVFLEYRCCTWKQRVDTKRMPRPYTEKLLILSNALVLLLNKLKSRARSPAWAIDFDPALLYPEFSLHAEIELPHVWTLAAMEQLESLEVLVNSAPDPAHSSAAEDLRLFLEYYRDRKQDMHAQLKKLESERQVSLDTIEYFFWPGKILVRRDGRGTKFEQAVKLLAWPVITPKWPDRRKKRHQILEKEELEKCKVQFEFSVSVWSFDGNFQIDTQKCVVSHTFDADMTLPITELPIYPLQYAPEKLEELSTRGMRFWKCRAKQYVQYSGVDYESFFHQPRTRFMIDMTPSNKNACKLRDDLSPEVTRRDRPPDGNFVLLLPSSISGFDMHNKLWRQLLVSNISDVEWDQQAFDKLVLDRETKDLIIALVTNKIDKEKSTDFMRGKGTGLVILFHGAPGTGKTLTAESVAEMAQKPLLRVTCGDIGTSPEAVEKHLKHVLMMGKAWDCVVLLDEAEVFLQQRALNNIERNALISVFLRILEYYDGIMVLTSNRVGIFDEAFKSRIQLAIHYENLTPSSREVVWLNFIDRLESFESDDVDLRDLRRHLKEMAKYEMNGRQIRNAITTGRQLAMYYKRPLDFDIMKRVIAVSGKFDKYIRSVNEGMDDEAIAREEQWR